jgi:hypothetical protein
VPFKNGHGLMTSPLKFESVRSSSAKQQDSPKRQARLSYTSSAIIGSTRKLLLANHCQNSRNLSMEPNGIAVQRLRPKHPAYG